MNRPRSTAVAGAVCAAVAAVASSAVPAAAATNSPAEKAAPAKSTPTTVAAAQSYLTRAKQELADAEATAARVRVEAAQGQLSPETLAQLASGTSSPFATGTPELQQVATLADQGDPKSVMSTLPIEELATMSPEPPQQPTPADEPKDPVKLADEQVRIAEKHEAGAQALLKQLEGTRNPDGPGAAKLADKCAGAGVVVQECTPPHWTEKHLKYDSVVIGRYVNAHWDAVKTVGGWRPYDAFPDHPSGRAVDIMMPHSGSTKGDVALGNAIAQYFQKHAKEYGIEYMIWRQRQWKAGTPVGDWNGMSDRGSPTANHMDHVHITVKDGHSGDAFRQLLDAAQAAA